MPQFCRTTLADVLIAFQKNPGVDSDNIINAGDAWAAGFRGPVRPQGKGYYGLLVEPGSSQVVTQFGTDYEVKRKARNAEEGAAANKITAWDEFWNESDIHKVQHYLQLLGYYWGKIDGDLGLLTERAVLAYQVDHKLRSNGLDWLADADSADAILKVVKKKNKLEKKDSGNEVYVIRRPLIRFERAPTGNADDTTGMPAVEGPEIDDRGFVKVSSNGHKCRGPVVSTENNQYFRVKAVREGIANTATLVVSSDDERLVVVPEDPLSNTRNMLIELQSGDPGAKSKKTKIHIKWQKNDNTAIEIATLRVIVMPMLEIAVRPYYVSIRGGDAGIYKSSTFTKAKFRRAFQVVNRIWRPYGIKFVFAAFRDKQVTLHRDGRIRDAQADEECTTMFSANDTNGHEAEKDKINLHLVRKIEDATGLTYDPFDYQWPQIGIALQRRTNSTLTGIDLAHELGHFLGLAHCFGRTKRIHAEDDPDDSSPKKDYFSIRRLMFGDYPKEDGVRPGDAWVHNVGYGDDQYGCLITLRNNPGDKTDNECQNSRTRATKSTLYTKVGRFERRSYK